MTATATIMARLTESAAIEIDRRGMADDRCACASTPSTPSSRRSGARTSRAMPETSAGTSSDAPMIVTKAER